MKFTDLFPTEQKAAVNHQISSDKTYQMQTGSGSFPYVFLFLFQVQQPCPDNLIIKRSKIVSSSVLKMHLLSNSVRKGGEAHSLQPLVGFLVNVCFSSPTKEFASLTCCLEVNRTKLNDFSLEKAKQPNHYPWSTVY